LISLVDTLTIDKSASKDDVKRAYFKLAKQYHPDINKEASAKEKFAEITE
jgi:DnaJ-class molecular chaperone